MIHYEIYRKQILNYLETVTMKFSALAKIRATYIKNTYGHIVDDKHNPYYLNLLGEYSKYNTPMYVTVETGEQVLFEKSLWDNHPKTARTFSIPSEEYTTLCLQYPTQVGLIKSIIYPVSCSIDELLEKRNLTILAHDPTLLHSNERQSVVSDLTQFLDYVHERWLVMDYDFEDQYPLVFMSMLYQLMFGCILTKRIQNLRTDNVHPLHIWEYLSSHGLAEYENVLTNKQAMFLYKNIGYLNANKGKKSTLRILADNLLRDFHIALSTKYIYQQTRDEADNCRCVPEFISEDVVSYSDDPLADTGVEVMDEILRKFKNLDIYPNYSTEDSVAMREKFGTTQINVLPTRIYEFKKYTINTADALYLTEFLIDSLLLHVANKTLNYKVQFKDPNTQIVISLSMQDMMVLFHYCLYCRFDGPRETIIPTLAEVRIPYKLSRPNENELPKIFYFNKFPFFISSIIDDAKLRSELLFDKGPFRTANEFLQTLLDQFTVQVKHSRETRLSASLRYQRCMREYYRNFVVRGVLDLNLSQYKTYDKWFINVPGVQDLITAYDELPNSQLYYEQLCDILLQAMLPITSIEGFSRYMGDMYDNTDIFFSIKKLFQSRCTYRLEFLDTARTSTTYLMFPSIAVATAHATESTDTRITDLASLQLVSLGTREATNTIVGNYSAAIMLDHQMTESTETTLQMGPATVTTQMHEAQHLFVHMSMHIKHSSHQENDSYTSFRNTSVLPVGCAIKHISKPSED